MAVKEAPDAQSRTVEIVTMNDPGKETDPEKMPKWVRALIVGEIGYAPIHEVSFSRMSTGEFKIRVSAG